ncbi:MAG: hypothetical protein OXF02_01080, partial [Simkaniaceae bacterium]|nr:hypothetical protein [Simkaniaceae bacterium]
RAFTRKEGFSGLRKRIDALEKLDYETFKKGALRTLARTNKRRIAITCEGKAPDEEKAFFYRTIEPTRLKRLQRGRSE